MARWSLGLALLLFLFAAFWAYQAYKGFSGGVISYHGFPAVGRDARLPAFGFLIYSFGFTAAACMALLVSKFSNR